MSSEEVVRQDPEFAALLQERAVITAEIQRVDDTLQAERHAVLADIQARRAALRAKEQATQAQVRGLEQRLDPARELLRAKLSDAEHSLRRAETTLSGLQRTRTELTRLLQHAGEGRESADVRQWRDQLAAIESQIPPLTQQQAALRQRRQLYQAQLRLLSR